ncbi:MAG TPA: hypothetical protein V6D31_05880 [Candidatus Sericytochromatia bacterium]
MTLDEIGGLGRLSKIIGLGWAVGLFNGITLTERIIPTSIRGGTGHLQALL